MYGRPLGAFVDVSGAAPSENILAAFFQLQSAENNTISSQSSEASFPSVPASNNEQIFPTGPFNTQSSDEPVGEYYKYYWNSQSHAPSVNSIPQPLHTDQSVQLPRSIGGVDTIPIQKATVDASTNVAILHRGLRSQTLSLNRMKTVLGTERKSRKRKRDSASRLKKAVEALPQELLDDLLKSISRSPSSRKDLVQSEIYDVAAILVESIPKLLKGTGQTHLFINDHGRD